MTRHFENAKSVQAQLDEMRELKTRLEVLTSEIKEYMDANDMDILKGETTSYSRTWVSDTLIFDSTKFKKEHADLYEQYKTKEKAGSYRYQEVVNK